MFLSRHRNTSGSLGELEILWKHEPTGECFNRFFELSQTFTPLSLCQQLLLVVFLSSSENDLNQSAGGREGGGGEIARKKIGLRLKHQILGQRIWNRTGRGKGKNDSYQLKFRLFVIFQKRQDSKGP